jgi:hypothetical protein
MKLAQQNETTYLGMRRPSSFGFKASAITCKSAICRYIIYMAHVPEIPLSGDPFWEDGGIYAKNPLVIEAEKIIAESKYNPAHSQSNLMRLGRLMIRSLEICGASMWGIRL